MKTPGIKERKFSGGFTLAEMAVSMGIVTVVMACMLSIFVMFLRSYNATSLMRNVSTRASLVLERMVYGIGGNAGLREVQSSTVAITYPSGGWKIAYGSLFFQYTTNTQSITDQSGKTICTNIVASTLNYTKPGIVTNGCSIAVTVAESAGGRTLTNAMSTYVQFRN